MTTYTALLIGFALGLAALIPLVLHLRPRFKAAGYARGYRTGHSEQYACIQALHHDIGQHKHIRDIERQGHQQRIEAVMQDCDDRIAIFARRANPFTQADLNNLQAIAKQLELAASTFAGLNAGDHAHRTRQLQQHTLNMAERLRVTLNAAEPLALPAANASVLVHGPMACGKTRNAHAIAAALGLTDIRDDWYPGIPVPRTNALVLTNSEAPFDPPRNVQIMSFEEAMRVVDVKRLEAAA